MENLRGKKHELHKKRNREFQAHYIYISLLAPSDKRLYEYRAGWATAAWYRGKQNVGSK
jgi:hypothetical protein